jgi:lipoprotein Spr
MLKRFAPLVPFALISLLIGCATQPAQPMLPLYQPSIVLDQSPEPESDESLPDLTDEKQAYKLPDLAENVLSHGLSLIGTRYRFGGRSANTGFDCSGFVGYLFKQEVGLELPRSTRELITLDAPRVQRDDLEPGDVIFFNDRGRGRVSHTGIYMGDNRFIHSSSSKSGGVRIDSLQDSYWSRSYLDAKRVLAMSTEAN